MEALIWWNVDMNKNIKNQSFTWYVGFRKGVVLAAVKTVSLQIFVRILGDKLYSWSGVLIRKDFFLVINLDSEKNIIKRYNFILTDCFLLTKHTMVLCSIYIIIKHTHTHRIFPKNSGILEISIHVDSKCEVVSHPKQKAGKPGVNFSRAT